MLKAALDFVFPPQCLHCDGHVPEHGTLCVACWQAVRFISDPVCACCGLPFPHDFGAEALCGDCLKERPQFSRARSVFCYDEHGKSLVLNLKYHDQLQMAPTLGTWLAKAGRDLVTASDVIVPVPLYYWRFVSRRYNQSALLSRVVSDASGVPWCGDALVRTRKTQPQAGLTRAQRLDNVRSAFRANPKHAPSLKGKTVLLVDDVMTTGATIAQCAHALIKGGAMSVNVLTLARTVD
jgi:ComF family protein